MEKCKICGDELETFLSLGKQPLANAFLKKEDLGKPEYMHELAAGFCKTCKMVQLVHTVPKEKLFNESYAYFSSVSKTMEDHFKEFSEELSKQFIERDKELIVEIGCNDGIMLKNFDRSKLRVLGVEPSSNVAEVAKKRGLEVIEEFFGSTLAKRIIEEKGKAKIIYGANVIRHIEALQEVAKGVSLLLEEKGIFVFEEVYLTDILEKNAYDQIYDEHVWFFSVTSLKNFFENYGLEIFDIKRQSTHGGSMRYYVCKKGVYPVNKKVIQTLGEEKAKGLLSLEIYKKFAREVEKSKDMLVKKLNELKAQNKRICGYAASAKGTVVLNYCNIGKDLLEYISDNTPTKQGLYSPGKHIPIVSPDVFHKNPPDYALLLAWNYAKEIKEKEKDSGVKFIVYAPYTRII